MPATYWVYILRCADSTLYIGETSCLSARIQQHHDGRGSLHTSSRLPVTLIYCEQHSTEISAGASDRSSAGLGKRSWPSPRAGSRRWRASAAGNAGKRGCRSKQL